MRATRSSGERTVCLSKGVLLRKYGFSLILFLLFFISLFTSSMHPIFICCHSFTLISQLFFISLFMHPIFICCHSFTLISQQHSVGRPTHFLFFSTELRSWFPVFQKIIRMYGTLPVQSQGLTRLVSFLLVVINYYSLKREEKKKILLNF